MPDKPQCFVISPIGAEDTPIRKHADEVLKFIIREALEPDYVVERADDHKNPGKITDSVFESICSYDVVVAVLTGHNPNVFYELAFAHAMGRPTILLVAKGETIPFDVRNERVIEYTLELSDYHSKRYIKALRAQADILTGAKQTRYSGPIPSHVLGGKAPEQAFTLYDRLAEFRLEQRLEFIKRGKTVFDCSGISLDTIPNAHETREFVKSSPELRMRILVMAPENSALAHMFNLQHKSYYASVAQKVETTRSFWSGLPNVEFRLVQNGIIYAHTIRTDTEVLVAPYLYSYGTNESMALLANSSSPLFKKAAVEFEELWRDNAPANL